jgi:sialate O-acetylesterase
MTKKICIGLTAFMLATVARAEVKLPSIVSDGMVLQREQTVPIWGWADANEQVVVKIADQQTTAKADASGNWRVELPAMKAGGPVVMTIAGSNTLTVKDVLIGDVWICGGQSNMEWPVRSTTDAKTAIDASADPMLHVFKVEHATSDKPENDCKASWAAAAPESVTNFSGVGYYFGKDLRKEVGVPVGLVQSTWGGTPAEAWMSDAALRQGSRFAGLFQRIDEWTKTAGNERADFDKKLAAWTTATKEARASGAALPKRPAQPKATRAQLYPSRLYNAMIAPIAPFGARGVIWYQGEANAERAAQYRVLLPALIADWRRAWESPTLPFGIVQLANLGPEYAKPAEPSTWCELRESQLLTAQQVPNCGLAVAIDIGEEATIHPKNKAEVGRRLSLWAQAKVYGRKLEYTGPIFMRDNVDGEKVRLTFAHADGLRAASGEQLVGFAIAGEDKVFHPANARIDGKDVIVSCDRVAKPQSVRYAWKKNPSCNLVNGAGLPASPFRTDDWPLATQGRE